MSRRPYLPDDWDSPRTMLRRVVYLIYAAGVMAGLPMLGGGAIAQDSRWALAGAVALVLSGLAREWLQKTGSWAKVEEEFEAIAHVREAPDPEPARQLAELLQQWQRLEQRRGGREFDPWALQAVRREIREVVDGDPALQQLFRH